MEFLGWSLLVVVMIICWPFIGAASYRFVNWYFGDAYSEEAAKAVILSGPFGFLLALISIASRFFKKQAGDLYKQFLKLAGKPDAKKEEPSND